MTSPPDDTTAHLHAVNAALRVERDAALAREATLAEELAARDAALARLSSQYRDRIEQQSETVGDAEALKLENQELRAAQAAGLEVLQAMVASPGDTQPVFDLIARQAADLCAASAAAVAMLDGTILHLATQYGYDPAFASVYATQFPRPVGSDTAMGRAILSHRAVQIEDLGAEPAYGMARALGPWSTMAVPLLRGGAPLGVLAVGRPAIGRFPDNQVTLLQTFAEQAVIAISSAETYRALQTRTGDLQETLEYQTATSDVLNVISRSTFDLQPVLDTVVETVARLCQAEMVMINRLDGDLLRAVANYGYPPELWAHWMAVGPVRLTPDMATVGPRTLLEGRVVHIHDVAAVPGYPVEHITLGKQRTTLGIPLLREGKVIGNIGLARQRVEPFTARQIALLENFADQAVIAMENARLLTEQREALEQQTATAEVLGVINASPGNLTPVFDAILDKAHTLCGAVIGSLVLFDGTHFRAVATHGFPEQVASLIRHPVPPNSRTQELIDGVRFYQIEDIRAIWINPDYLIMRAFVEYTDVRTALFVPLRKDGALLGFISAFRPEVRAFSEKEIALLENFAAQAVIAMENARLLTEQQEALEQQTATAEVLQVINASPGNLAPVFDAMLDKAMRLCGAAYGVLRSFDGARLETLASRGVPLEYAEFLARNADLKILGADSTTLMQALRTGQSTQILDVREGIAYKSRTPGSVAIADLGGARTLLHVPLMKDLASVGLFTIYRQEVRGFSDKQIALLQNFAAQAVIAMENARLITEQREALEQQTATAEVLRVINASPGNLAPVFDAMLEKAMRLCRAAFGSLYTYDGARFHTAAQRGVPAAFAEIRMKSPPVSPPGSPIARSYEAKRSIQVLDVMAGNDYQAGQPTIRELVDVGGVRTLLVVPLFKDETPLGHFALYRQKVLAFSGKQIALLENFAAQAVIAMENARLITEQHEALEQQTATAEVLQVINANPGDLTPVFDTLLEKALHLCQSAFGILSTYDGEFFHNVAFRGVTPELAEYLRKPFLPVPGSGLHKVFEGEDMLHTPDIVDDDAYRRGIPARRALADLGGARTQLLVALRKDGVLLGVLNIFRREVRPFTDKQIALLQNFAAQAVIAMENARLLNEIRQRQEELRITFENMGDGVAMFDADLRLAAWNRNFQQIIDLPDALLRERPRYADYMRLLAERGEFGTTDIEVELRHRIEDTDQELRLERVRPDGRVIEVRRNAVPGGGFVLIYSDITERKRSEEEIRAARDAAETALRELRTAQANLIQAEKMASLGQLTAGIAHEIKNPLNFVNNFSALSTELIDELRDVLAPEPLGETARTEVDDLTALLKGNLEKVVQHGQRADGIVRSMLDHSRGSSGERRMVDLNALIDEALNLAYHGARAQDQSFNITLERDFGEGISPIEVNPQDITRVFLNIFANGFYAATRRARDGGDAGFVPTLKVTTIDAGEAVQIRVRDNGTGIPADIRDKLFQPFFTTKPTGEGTGLGLSITYDIVTQQHGGSITVDSKVGNYSEFTIRLPRS